MRCGDWVKRKLLVTDRLYLCLPLWSQTQPVVLKIFLLLIIDTITDVPHSLPPFQLPRSPHFNTSASCSKVEWSTILVCSGLKRFPGDGTYGAQTGRKQGKPGQGGCPISKCPTAPSKIVNSPSAWSAEWEEESSVTGITHMYERIINL